MADSNHSKYVFDKTTIKFEKDGHIGDIITKPPKPKSKSHLSSKEIKKQFQQASLILADYRIFF